MFGDYIVKYYFNGIWWDDSYTDDYEEAQYWKTQAEDVSASIWDRMNGGAIEQFIDEYVIIDAESIEITAEVEKM